MNRRLLYLLMSILVLKAVLLALDSYVGVMFGDSGSYVTTALIKWIPPDRSFIYGFILRRLTVSAHSLIPAIYFQSLLSGIASWLVAVCLVKFFRARFSVAVVLSLLCAVEPLQLMFERYILPDSLTASLFAILMFAVFSYMKQPGYVLLVGIQLISTLLASLRLNFVPVAIVISLLVPLLSLHSLRAGGRVPWPAAKRMIVVPLLASILLSQGLLFGYRLVYGHLIQKPPAYSYSDGAFLLAVVVPILQPDDFPSGVDSSALLKAVKFPMSDPHLRPQQHWTPGGLCDTIRHAVGNEDEANTVMKETAVHAIVRNPVGVAKLAAGLYLDFFNLDLLRATLRIEEGNDDPADPEMITLLNDAFRFNVLNLHFESITKVWHRHAQPWYWFLLVFPFLYPIYLFVRRGTIGPPHILCALFALGLLLEAVVPVERIVTRYLTPLAWLVFVMIGAMLPSARGDDSSYL